MILEYRRGDRVWVRGAIRRLDQPFTFWLYARDLDAVTALTPDEADGIPALGRRAVRSVLTAARLLQRTRPELAGLPQVLQVHGTRVTMALASSRPWDDVLARLQEVA